MTGRANYTVFSRTMSGSPRSMLKSSSKRQILSLRYRSVVQRNEIEIGMSFGRGEGSGVEVLTGKVPQH